MNFRIENSNLTNEVYNDISSCGIEIDAKTVFFSSNIFHSNVKILEASIWVKNEEQKDLDVLYVINSVNKSEYSFTHSNKLYTRKKFNDLFINPYTSFYFFIDEKLDNAFMTISYKII